jgi:hypothetical protein
MKKVRPMDESIPPPFRLFLFCLDSVAGKVARALPLKHRGRVVTRTTTNKAAADRRTRTMRAACSHERACHSWRRLAIVRHASSLTHV